MPSPVMGPSSGGGGASYLVYAALLTQSGTSAPVATVLENTLGGTVVWARSAGGIYTGTLAGAFTADKTALSVASGPAPASNANIYCFFFGRTDADEVVLTAKRATVSEFGSEMAL